MKKLLYTLVLPTLLLASCEKSTLEPVAFVNHIQQPENGLMQSKAIAGIEFSAQYKPHEYIVAREERKNQLESETVQERLEELEGMHYFNFRIRLADSNQEVLKYGLTSEEEYQQRIYYLSFGLRQDIKLLQNGKEVPCELFHFARSYGLSPTADFALGFPAEALTEDLQLVLEDRIFNSGQVKFTFDKNDLKSVPVLLTH